MKNTAATSAKKRSNSSEGVAEPPAKRPSRDVAAKRPSCYELTPELIGHIARFLPMGTSDMMRLLLCVGPHVAAVVRKMYLTGNDYYLGYYMYGFEWYKMGRAKECIGYWMDYNERAWKKRCLGKKHKDNVLSVMFTPDQFRSLNFGKLYGLNPLKHGCSASSLLDEESINVLQKLAKNSPHLFLISVGDKYFDDGRYITEEDCDALVDAATVNSDGKICVQFMRNNYALFAYPLLFLACDLVDVLRYMIEENIIRPNMMISIFTKKDILGDRNRIGQSLLYMAVVNESAKCFHYLLSLPGTEINAVAFSREEDNDDFRSYYGNIIHSCLKLDWISPSYLEGIIAHPDVDLNLRNSHGETAFCCGCKLGDDLGDDLSDTIDLVKKLRLLLEAGADPRIEDEEGNSPLSHIVDQIRDGEWEDWDPELKTKLVQLQEEISQRIQVLNNMGAQST